MESASLKTAEIQYFRAVVFAESADHDMSDFLDRCAKCVTTISNQSVDTCTISRPVVVYCDYQRASPIRRHSNLSASYTPQRDDKRLLNFTAWLIDYSIVSASSVQPFPETVAMQED